MTAPLVVRIIFHHTDAKEKHTWVPCVMMFSLYNENEAGLMKKRFIYALLFGIPGFFVAVIIAFFSIGAWTGLLWVFVFGDNPWPSMTEGTLFILFTVIFLLVWIILMAIGFSIGRKLENDPLLNKQHILLSGVITLLFILMIAIQQLSVGDKGPKSDGVLCSDYCL